MRLLVLAFSGPHRAAFFYLYYEIEHGQYKKAVKAPP